MPDLPRFWTRLNLLESPRSLLDIFFVALLFFWLLEVIQGTRAMRALRGVGILLFIAMMLSTTVSGLTTLTWLLRTAIYPALFVAIPVLFQPELRRAMERLGRTGGIFSSFPFSKNTDSDDLLETVNGVSRAAAQLSKQNIGALILIERETRLQEYAERGVILDARLAVPLLLNIFYPNSPLHDMAVIIRDNRILAANVVLPLSEDVVGGHRRFGTRHRAAKGISEQSDAVVVVVSEETGTISLVYEGRMTSYLNETRLRNMLAPLLHVSLEESSSS
jgi:diadenylate cyclase